MEEGKYYEVTDIRDQMIKENKLSIIEDKNFEKIFICSDCKDFWIVRILKDINKEYKKEEGSYLLEREEVDKFYFVRYVIDTTTIENFELCKNSVNDLIEKIIVEKIAEYLLIIDGNRGHKTCELKQYENFQDIIYFLDDGTGIVKLGR